MTYARVVFIEWLDSQSTVGWDSYETFKGFPSTFSIGILVEEAKDHYAIAHSYDPESDEFNGLMRIPFIAVIKARTLCTIQLKTMTTT